MTTTAKRAATPSGGGSRAARAERNGKREMDFKGLKLSIPSVLPTSFAYRFAKISALEERGDNASGVVYELLVKVIGEDQFDAVCDHVDTIRKDVSVVDLVIALLEEYDTDTGKSEASASS